MEGGDVHGGETAPAVAHNGDIQIPEAGGGLQGVQAVVQVPQGLGQAPGTVTARLHAAGVVIGVDQEASAAEHFNFLHVGPVAAAEAVVKDHQPARDDLVVAVEPALHLMAQAGFEIKGLLPQAGEIGVREIMGKAFVIAAAEKLLLVDADDFLFKDHNETSFLFGCSRPMICPERITVSRE